MSLFHPKRVRLEKGTARLSAMVSQGYHQPQGPGSEVVPGEEAKEEGSDNAISPHPAGRAWSAVPPRVSDFPRPHHHLDYHMSNWNNEHGLARNASKGVGVCSCQNVI